MFNIGELRYSIKEILVKKKDGTGIIDLKEIYPINIDKFLEGERSYYNSYELWKETKKFYKGRLENEIRRISQEFKLPYQTVEEEFLYIFRPSVYDGSMCEAIVNWNIEQSNKWTRLPVSSEEDRKYKIDVRALHKSTSKTIHFQVKKYPHNAPKEFYEKVENDLKIAEKKFGKRPELIFIDFDEANKNQRTLLWTGDNGTQHPPIPFPRSFGRTRAFEKSFDDLLETIVSQNKYKEKISAFEFTF